MTTEQAIEILKILVNNPLLGVVIGGVMALLGNSYFQEKKRAREKKIEILENLQMIISQLRDTLSLWCSMNIQVQFFGTAIAFDQKSHQDFLVFKEEFQRWSSSHVELSKDVIALKGEVWRNFASYKIHFGKDDKFFNLLNDFMKPSSFKPKEYKSAPNLTVLYQMQEGDMKRLNEEWEKEMQPRHSRIIDYLDSKIDLLGSKTK